MKRIIFILAILASGVLSAQQTKLHSYPEEFRGKTYKVWVNGQNAEIFHADANTYIVNFDMTDTVVVKVLATVKGFWQNNAIVRPLSKHIRTQLIGDTVCFTINKPGQFTLERSTIEMIEGSDVLMIFANPMETKRPSNLAANTIYLAPGIHQRNIDLKTGQTLYLASGAVLFGSVNIWNASNVRIAGRGTIVYYGPQSLLTDIGWRNLPNWRPLTTHKAKNITIEGITIINRARTWCIQLFETEDVLIDNMKLVAMYPSNNGDGIDWMGGGNARIVNSFIKANDDCFALFIPSAAQVMWPNYELKESGMVKNIAIRNCVLWPARTNLMRVGFNGQVISTNNIQLNNCDIIHTNKGRWNAPRSLICSDRSVPFGKGKHTNYCFEDIRIEESIAFLGLQNSESHFDTIVFKNIDFGAPITPSLIQCKAENIVFEKINNQGELIKSISDLSVETGSRGFEKTIIK